MIRPGSIYFRHLVSHLLVILFLILAVAGFVFYFLYSSNGNPNLHKRVSEVAECLANDPNSGIPDEQTWLLLGKAANATLWLSDTEGAVLAGTPPDIWLPGKDEQVRSLNAQSGGRPVFLFSVATMVEGSPALVWAYQDRGNLFWLSEPGKLIWGIPLVTGMLAAIVLSFRISRSMTASMADIAAAAARFAAGDHSGRTTTTGNDELGDLGRNFNAMADVIVKVQQTRREFYANISHELKTPLSCIQAITEALVDGIAKTPDELRQYLDKIHTETLRMSRMVHDLLDLEQLESGKLHIRREQVDIQLLISEQADKIQDMLKKKNLLLVIRFATDKRTIWGDEDRLFQVFDNLLSNAIRHAPPGSRITISTGEADNRLQIAVSDQGEGISAEDLPLIWERFYRTDKARARITGGTGLGLPIARSLVEAMGGSISVKSTKEQGTTFFLGFAAD